MRNLCAWPKDVSCLRLCSSKCLIKQMCHVCERISSVIQKSLCFQKELVLHQILLFKSSYSASFQRIGCSKEWTCAFPLLLCNHLNKSSLFLTKIKNVSVAVLCLGCSMQLVHTLLLSVNDCPYSKWLREIHLLYLPIMLTIIVSLGLSASCAKVLLFGFYWDLMNITSKFFPFQRSSMKSRYPFWIENSRGWLVN